MQEGTKNKECGKSIYIKIIMDWMRVGQKYFKNKIDIQNDYIFK